MLRNGQLHQFDPDEVKIAGAQNRKAPVSKLRDFAGSRRKDAPGT